MRILFPPRLLVVAAVAVAVYPELVKKCKPAARAVADGMIKLGENLREAAKEVTAEPKSDAKAEETSPPEPKAPESKAAVSEAPKAKAKTTAKPKPTGKTGAKKVSKPKAPKA